MGESLIVYFSRTGENYGVGYVDKGNTEIVAEYVQELTGADLFKVEPTVPYSDKYDVCIKEAKERIGAAPIQENPPALAPYDTVFIMSPIYWGTYAPEIETAIKDLDWTGKKVRVVSTHEGSGLGKMVADVTRICKGADVDKTGLAIKGSQAKSSKSAVANWL